MTDHILSRFRPQVSAWFRDVFAHPTAVQQRAWEVIGAGSNALVVAPTGSGKTLAAFLWAINSLVDDDGQTALDVPVQPKEQPAAQSGGQRPSRGVRVLYISPLKALGVDVQRNLRAPLTGIARTADRLGMPAPDITVGVRSGDTPPAQRARLQRTPPDVLITTPESLYLMLTSKAAGTLRGVDTVIVDEIHALAGTKRGVHLSLSLERLEHLAEGPIQRIGLSATVRPVETVAEFLGGAHPVAVIDPPSQKAWDFSVRVPVDDMSDLPEPEQGSTIGEAVIDDPLGLTTPIDPAAGADASAVPVAADSALPTARSIWPFVEQAIYEQVMEAHSTLVFVNSRRTAERLTSRLNELYAAQYDPDSLAAPTRRDPAQLMKAVDTAGSAPAIIARAHHGSVSKDERAATEMALKEGRLRAVVATSSLELGIDMGAVDLVIQVESPPSVASGVQRAGRAGHAVGAVSRATFYPKHRADLVATAVTVERMRDGLIEELHVPTNPLDVLVQQTIAAVAVEEWNVDQWYATVRRAYAYKQLPRPIFDAVIDLACGAYPSTDFASLRPRLVLDPVTGVLSARPGAQRVAVTSGGTIPDRGMFGVFLVGGESGARRVGELDEEMVYESRVGDVFTLGASSWRIENITRDQVQVSPAPGHTGRLPFWGGDQPGRPAELGRAVGQYRRRVAGAGASISADLDQRAATNLRAYLSQQEEATGVVPDERTLVMERFRDELGDWRVVLHTPYGRGVNAAWALAVGARMSQDYGIDAQAVAGDDGIVVRLPETDEPPRAELFIFDAEDIEEQVTERVGDSALFASRFRECAARALLLPRRNPGTRAPLWQQRQRAAQLLDVARKYPSFPIILETVRECLQDVYDLPALTQLCRDIAHRRVRIVEVTTEQPSPFAATLLFNYTGAFMYEGDAPAAEKRAAALALDPTLLATLLGRAELADLLDPDIIAEVHATLQHTAAGRRARTPEELADQLRVLGPIAEDELAQHCDFPDPLPATLAALTRRVMRVRINGRPHLAQVLDAPLLRDGLGIPVPPGIAAPVDTIADALDQLVARWARSRGPFSSADLAAAFGLSPGAAHTAVQAAVTAGIVTEGTFQRGTQTPHYCATDVLTILRRRSLAAARAQTQPVSQSAFARFLPSWQHVAPVGQRPELTGIDGTYTAIEQLAGVRLPASAWESLVLPARVADYNPAWLDELTAAGEVLIVGAGAAAGTDPWITLLPVDLAADLAPQVSPEDVTLTRLQEDILGILSRGGAYLASELIAQLGAPTEDVRKALWGLVDASLVTPDSFARVRAHLGSGAGSGARSRTAHRARRGRAHSRTVVPADLLGRWARTVTPTAEPTARSVSWGRTWLDRYGVVTRGSVTSEDIPGGFALAYKVLTSFEETGKAVRGYLVESLGAAQFSTSGIIDRLRGCSDGPDVQGWPSGARDPHVYVLAAADPANPYGASLPWPRSGPTRAAGALVVLIDGLLIAHLTRGGRTLSTFFDAVSAQVGIPDHQLAAMVIAALAAVVDSGRVQPWVMETIDSQPALSHPWVPELRRAGALLSPRGIKIGGHSAGGGSPWRGAEGDSGGAGGPRGPRGRRGRSLDQALDRPRGGPRKG
ncbi:Lhr family helicase [Corynebacterium uberis]|uniref:Lhr family helicase n=1 Tax=Corynebacterium uberis TaxID=2883169 RepID=UPI001D0B758B|nr:crosslink repair DNA glycosylase YcaQ family protein [Corynebacterium uberis]UDL72716.1 DEAD/DEAH box helicase [Corynebacterium uberis]UDL78620.1 DEAD/DEAH box helicase [Corynebacterium uberis]UDL85244.1 DEAD/DEAH box helicase [Corynebacterium uberis]